MKPYSCERGPTDVPLPEAAVIRRLVGTPTLNGGIGLWMGLGLLIAGTLSSWGQAVGVTMALDTNRVGVGQTTTLRIYGQVLPLYRASSDRIFSWYLDVLNTNSPVASANYESLLKPASDNEPSPVSSTGFNEGANRRGIYDTFLNMPGAGVMTPVILMEIPVTGLTLGRTRFRVEPGTGVGLAEDFIVAPLGGGSFLSGGDYNAAQVELEVIQACRVTLEIDLLPGPGLYGRSQITFVPCSGYDHTVETNGDLLNGSWGSLGGGPHNSGSVTYTNTVSPRFFRVLQTPL